MSCPCCGKVYRLSDSHIFSGKLPNKDWKSKLEEERVKISKREAKIKANISKLKSDAKEKGRSIATEQVSNIDRVFAPLGLKAMDCKNICYPVDYIVFNGLHDGNVKNLVLLDRGKDTTIQQSIRRAIEEEKYSWRTIRVDVDGKLSEE